MLSINVIVEVKDITEQESQELLRNLCEKEGISPMGQTDIDDFEFGLRYNGTQYMMYHDKEKQKLYTQAAFWEENQNPGSRWLGDGTVDGVIGAIRPLSDLRDEIEEVTHKEVVAEFREHSHIQM